MISFEKTDKKLVVPSALGNFGNAGGGSGSGMTPAEVQELIDASIDVYDTEIQVDLEDIRENVSGNTEDIAELSASTVALEQRVDGISLSGITQDINTLSGTVSTLESGFNTLSGTTENISSNVNTLSAATDNIRTDIETLSGYSQTRFENISNTLNVVNPRVNRMYTEDIPALSASTSANTADIAALSGSVETLSASTASGLQTANNAASSAHTLAGSAYTRADAAYALAESLSGQSGGGATVYVLNIMTQEERAALYAELFEYRVASLYSAVSSGFPVGDYAFYYWAGGDNSDEFNDNFRGFVPLQIAMLHPDDYGGAVFFTGLVKTRQGDSSVVEIRYNLTADGSADISRHWLVYSPAPGMAFVHIDSAGTFYEADAWELGNISNSEITFRVWIAYNGEDGTSQSPVEEFRHTYEEVEPDDWRDVYYFSTTIAIGSDTYKGKWRLVDYGDWGSYGPYPAVSWVQV